MNPGKKGGNQTPSTRVPYRIRVARIPQTIGSVFHLKLSTATFPCCMGTRTISSSFVTTAPPHIIGFVPTKIRPMFL